MPEAPKTRDGAAHRDRLRKQMARIAADVWKRASSERSVTVISSPPGAGKTSTLIEIVGLVLKARRRVGVACQTNAQAEDVCTRLVKVLGSGRVTRFISSTASPDPPCDGCLVASKADAIEDGPHVVVGTAAKWALIEKAPEVDLIIVDEAWQMALSTFLPLLRFCDRFVLIGDPGQIPPVVSAATERWETSRNPPHRAAPDVLIERLELKPISLPATWRLPFDTARLIRDFYEFDFESAALAGERTLEFKKVRGEAGAADRALDRLARGSIARLVVPMPSAGGLVANDPDVAAAAAEVVGRALDRVATFTARDDENPAPRRLEPTDIGIAATHRVLVQAIATRLPARYRDQVKVDTAERWQGLQRELMVVVHPLSSMVNPGEFDLETGRLCVMASRHRSGLVVVGREHIGATLEGILPVASQPLGQPDAFARGLKRHRAFWHHLESSEATA